MQAKIITAGRSDIGRLRKSNQDQFAIADLHKTMAVAASSMPISGQARLLGSACGRLLLVADGMGGHRAGSRASLMALDLVINQLVNRVHWPMSADTEGEKRFIAELKQLVEATHRVIFLESQTHADYYGMGTTLTMCYIAWPAMYLVHVGDSRCYLIRDKVPQQLTLDHTVSAQFTQNVEFASQNLETSPWRHVLYNALGAGSETVVVDVQKVDLKLGDHIALCTDGFYQHISARELADELAANQDLDEACRRMVDLANTRGGNDNITVVVARCDWAPDTRKMKTVVASETPLEHLLGELKDFEPVLAEASSGADGESSGEDTVDF